MVIFYSVLSQLLYLGVACFKYFLALETTSLLGLSLVTPDIALAMSHRVHTSWSLSSLNRLAMLAIRSGLIPPLATAEL